VAPAFADTVEQVKPRAETMDEQSIERLLVNLLSTKTNLIVEVSSLGMSCGPEFFRVLYGFDFQSPNFY